MNDTSLLLGGVAVNYSPGWGGSETHEHRRDRRIELELVLVDARRAGRDSETGPDRRG